MWMYGSRKKAGYIAGNLLTGHVDGRKQSGRAVCQASVVEGSVGDKYQVFLF